jgi:hypothetical protein
MLPARSAIGADHTRLPFANEYTPPASGRSGPVFEDRRDRSMRAKAARD